MKENPQQLNTLLRQFADEKTARDMAGDIRQMDELLASQTSPEVSRQTLSAVKARVRQRLADRGGKSVHWGMRLWLTSAAAILLVAGAPFFFTARQPEISHPLAAASYLWDDGAASENDPVGSLSTRIEMAAGQIDSVHGQSSSWFEDDSSLAVEIQDAQIIVADTDFWKG